MLQPMRRETSQNLLTGRNLQLEDKCTYPLCPFLNKKANLLTIRSISKQKKTSGRSDYQLLQLEVEMCSHANSRHLAEIKSDHAPICKQTNS